MVHTSARYVSLIFVVSTLHSKAFVHKKKHKHLKKGETARDKSMKKHINRVHQKDERPSRRGGGGAVVSECGVTDSAPWIPLVGIIS